MDASHIEDGDIDPWDIALDHHQMYPGTCPGFAAQMVSLSGTSRVY